MTDAYEESTVPTGVCIGRSIDWAPAWSPEGTRIAFLRFAGNPTGGVPLLDVRVLDLGSGKITNVGVQVATDLNGPSWASNTTLLVNRYD